MTWFGTLVAVNLQTAFMTPPFGATLFYMKGTAPPGVTMSDVFRAMYPFVALQVLGLLLCIYFPGISSGCRGWQGSSSSDHSLHGFRRETLRRQRHVRGTVEADKSALALRLVQHSHSHASVLCPLSSIAWSSARFRGLAILAVCGSRRGIAEIRPALPPHHQPENNCHKNCVQKRRPASRIKKLTPVRLPLGRLRLATIPNLTGSLPLAKTIGVVEVDALAASAETAPPVAKITAACRQTKSAASAGTIVLTVRPAVFDRYVLALDVAVFTKASAKRSHVRRDAVER